LEDLFESHEEVAVEILWGILGGGGGGGVPWGARLKKGERGGVYFLKKKIFF